MRRSGLALLMTTVVISFGSLLWSLLAGNSILLGLDLQGGTEVVLEPKDDQGVSGSELEAALGQATEIIRNRVDGLGVAEPDITQQGNRIVVQLAGVADQARALEIVGKTAELRFRPVCAQLGPPIDEAQTPTPTADGTDPEATPTADSGSVDDPDATATETVTSDAEATPAAEATAGADATPTPTPTEAPTPRPTIPPDALEPDLLQAAGCADLSQDDVAGAFIRPLTDPEDDLPESVVILPEFDDDGNVVNRWLLGSTLLTGEALETADSTPIDATGTVYAVNPTYKSGPEGIDLFNAAATECFGATPTCPTTQLAIVLDGVVISAPQIQQATFERDRIQITAGDPQQGQGYTRDEAEADALVLKYGALPLEFKDPAEGGFVRQVSATVGKDALRAGVAAGIVGAALVALYMILYYRLLGVAAVLALGMLGVWLWVILAWLSATQSLALTLAGVVGLIVSIGTSLDTHIVYFEHLKEDILNGRTLRSSMDRSFPAAFKTIVFANSATLIGAVILYFLTVGSVRGFAFVLGLASLLDLAATYFVLRPLVKLFARSERFASHPQYFGLPLTERVDPAGGAS